MVQSLHFDPKISNEVWFELPYDKTNKTTCAPREDSDQPEGIHPVWSEFLLWDSQADLSLHCVLNG